VYVGIGIGGIFYSYDGIIWYNSSSGTSFINNTSLPQIGKICWNGNLWVAVGNGGNYTIAYSYDGINWLGVSNSSTIFNASGGAMDIVWNGTQFVAVGSIYYINNTGLEIYYPFNSTDVSQNYIVVNQL